ncbi:uncharacterized, partial [Tachysurus ichikawai]
TAHPCGSSLTQEETMQYFTCGKVRLLRNLRTEQTVNSSTVSPVVLRKPTAEQEKEQHAAEYRWRRV